MAYLPFIGVISAMADFPLYLAGFFCAFCTCLSHLSNINLNTGMNQRRTFENTGNSQMQTTKTKAALSPIVIEDANTAARVLSSSPKTSLSQTNTRSPQPIERPIIDADVRPGDILLLHYTPDPDPDAEFRKLLGLALQAIDDWNHWDSYSQKQKEQQFAKLMPLIHFAITLFDGDIFFHAAVVGTDDEGNKAVIEASTGGIARTPLSAYWGGLISVYRYCHGAITIGSAGLPVAPVTNKAAALFAGSTIQYGHFHAGLLAIWCLFRGGEDQVIVRLKAVMEHAFGKAITDILFQGDGEKKIKLLLINVFQAALDHWREQGQMVCSEMVAACFNDADSKGTYRISRETEKMQSGPFQQSAMTNSFAGLDVKVAREQMAELAAAVTALEPAKSLRSLRVAMELVDTDILYTPRDLKASISTFLVGEGHIGGGMMESHDRTNPGKPPT